MASIQGTIADAIVTVLQQAQTEAVLETAIGSGEGALENFVHAALTGVHVGGVLALVYPSIEAAVEAEVKAVVSQYTPQDIVQNIIIPAAIKEAKALGG